MDSLFKPGKWDAEIKNNAVEFQSIQKKPILVQKSKLKKKNKKSTVKREETAMETCKTDQILTLSDSTKKNNGGRVSKSSINQTSKTKESSSLKRKLQETLKGGRFRFLNEQLYTMRSDSAVKLFADDVEAFAAYHDGYRSQVEKWPFNPLDRIIKTIKKMRKDLVVGDFGCGEARLAQSVTNKVFSIDLVSSREDIIASDMAFTPLSKKSLDIAVYCLSLMGTNLNDCLLEANRVLKIGGILLIAEIASRFAHINDFVRGVELCGFKLLRKDTEEKKIFYFFQFKKVIDVQKDAKLPEFSLQPCLYRKR